MFLPRASEDGHWDYAAAGGGDDLVLDVHNTAIRPRNSLFPQREILAEFEREVEGACQKLEVKETLPRAENVVSSASGPATAGPPAHGQGVQRRVHGSLLRQRRDQTTLVGLACDTPPRANCFCTVGRRLARIPTDGLDVLMTDLGDRYFVKAITETGEELDHGGRQACYRTPQPRTRNR